MTGHDSFEVAVINPVDLLCQQGELWFMVSLVLCQEAVEEDANTPAGSPSTLVPSCYGKVKVQRSMATLQLNVFRWH